MEKGEEETFPLTDHVEKNTSETLWGGLVFLLVKSPTSYPKPIWSFCSCPTHVCGCLSLHVISMQSCTYWYISVGNLLIKLFIESNNFLTKMSLITQKR